MEDRARASVKFSNFSSARYARASVKLIYLLPLYKGAAPRRPSGLPAVLLPKWSSRHEGEPTLGQPCGQGVLGGYLWPALCQGLARGVAL